VPEETRESDYPKVTRMPLIVKGTTCPYCHLPVRGKYVYSADGRPWRCFNCIRKLAGKIVAIRSK
jgi:hypothetical protein